MFSLHKLIQVGCRTDWNCAYLLPIKRGSPSPFAVELALLHIKGDPERRMKDEIAEKISVGLFSHLADYYLHRGQAAPLVWLVSKYLQELIITPPSLLIFPTELKHPEDKLRFKLTRQTSSLSLKSSKSELTSPINSRIESHKLNIWRTSPLFKWCFLALMDLAVAGSQRKAVLTKSLTDYAFFPYSYKIDSSFQFVKLAEFQLITPGQTRLVFCPCQS